MNEFIPVNHYYIHMMNKTLGDMKPLFNELNTYGKTMGIVMDRQDQFQTELFIVPADIEIIEFHIHPNVDSIEVPLSGDFTFRTNNQDFPNFATPEMLREKRPAWVGSNDIHGAIWRGGGAFLSFQYWKNGVKPTSVIKDYLLDEKNELHEMEFKGLSTEEYNSLKRLTNK